MGGSAQGRDHAKQEKHRLADGSRLRDCGRYVVEGHRAGAIHGDLITTRSSSKINDEIPRPRSSVVGEDHRIGNTGRSKREWESNAQSRKEDIGQVGVV